MEEFYRLVFVKTGTNTDTGSLRIFAGDDTCSDDLSVHIKVRCNGHTSYSILYLRQTMTHSESVFTNHS